MLKKKLILCIGILMIFAACKKQQEQALVAPKQNQTEYLKKNKFNIKKGKLQRLSPEVSDLVKDWIEFNGLYESMKLLNSSSRFTVGEDLSQIATFIDNIQKVRYPKGLEATQIKSRFTLLKTKVLKLKDDASNKTVSKDSVQKRIVEINTVFHSVLNQIVETTKKEIDPEEIIGNNIIITKEDIELSKEAIKQKSKKIKAQN